MPAYCDWDIQKALYDRLTAAAGLTALLAEGAQGVRDHVPADAAFPYLVIGEAQSRPHRTQGMAGREAVFTLHVYSRQPGLKEMRGILQALHDALEDAPLTVAGQDVILCRALEAESFLDNDGETRRGSMQVRIVTEPAD